ncbi:hypothetical protein OCU04_006202 [Sclerotinia nivalis]|uniref:Uncharacterized protein n=1 Tax=Sclerotinia nivalis TaxID=352851 RepID=A0A9X0DKB5_9HELO|nr:hypothetical protein OCU04_006202 [Sclerotinia nivalis]
MSSPLQLADHTLLTVFSRPRILIISNNPTSNAIAYHQILHLPRLHITTIVKPRESKIMCYVLVERHSVCRCIYYTHATDMCPAYGVPGHNVEERTLLVGYICNAHSSSY